jgi:hypothetical protein
MDYEAEKIAIERQKLALERLRLRGEASRAKWTAISVMVPLLAALLTVALGFWSTREQAQSQFRLEVAKAIMLAPTLTETLDRAELFRDLFPAEIGDIVKASNAARSDARVTRPQLELFHAMAARDMKPRQILDLWIALRPEDDWATRPDVRSATDPLPGSN